MKICVISTTIFPCPPTGYAGLEMVAWQQADQLAKLGHQVLLVAPVGSQPPHNVELHGTTQGEPEKNAFNGYAWRLSEFDVIIDNSWEKWSYMAKKEGLYKKPILGVLHAPAETMYRTPPPVDKPCIVSISDDQGSVAKELWKVDTRTAYNGVDTEFYNVKGMRNGRYLFLARMSTIKGPHIALDICKRLRFQLDMVGDDKFTGEVDLAKSLQEGCDCINWIYHGGVSREQTVEFYTKSRALLHMNRDFREPFGLAPVEAMLCGCPVIAWDNGAMRETIVHGSTGFLVKSIEEVEELIRTDAVSKIDRSACRAHALKFSVEKFGKRYDELVKEAEGSGGW